MKSLATATTVTIAIAAFAGAPALAQQQPVPARSTAVPALDIENVAPVLGRYESDVVINGLWKRPQLSPRDRSIVTVAILVARSRTADLPHYMKLALDSGVTPKELSEIITHLAFYAGWTNAMAAVAIANEVYAERNIGSDQLPTSLPDLLPLDEEGEAARQRAVQGLLGTPSPRLADFTTDPLFKDVWLRPDLSPRDRSLVTISSLMANG